jgi:hypothetical protein
VLNRTGELREKRLREKGGAHSKSGGKFAVYSIKLARKAVSAGIGVAGNGSGTGCGNPVPAERACAPYDGNIVFPNKVHLVADK